METMLETEVVLGDVVLGEDIPISDDTNISLSGEVPMITNRNMSDFEFLDEVGIGLTAYDTPPGTRPSSKGKSLSRRSSGQHSSRRGSNGQSSRPSTKDSDRGTRVYINNMGSNNGYYYEDTTSSRPSTTSSSIVGQDIMFLDNNDRSFSFMANQLPAKDPYFMFTEKELAPELAASKAERICKKDKFIDSGREARKALKAERARAAAAREAVRKQRADLEKSEARVMKRRSDVPEDLRFSQANVVSYDIPGLKPYKCCGTFYVQPFSIIAPPKRVTRTEQQWRDAGLLPQLPGQPGGFVTKEMKEAERRKLEIHQLLQVPVRTHQLKPPSCKMNRKLEGPKSKLYPSNSTYPSGTTTFNAPTWDLPDKPSIIADTRNLKKSNQFSQSGRILISGDLPPEPAPFISHKPKSMESVSKPKIISNPPTLSSTSPAPKIDIRKYPNPIVHQNSKDTQVGDWWRVSYLPTPDEPPIGRRGDGTIKTNPPTTDDSKEDLKRHAQTKSEIAEAVNKYRQMNQPSDVLILHARTGEVRSLARKNQPLKTEGNSEPDEQEVDALKPKSNTIDALVESSQEFEKLFATSDPQTAEDWSVLSPTNVLSEWLDMSDWEAGLRSKKTPGTASRRPLTEEEPRIMSAMANDDLPLVRGTSSEEGVSKPSTASLWRSSRGQPTPPQSPSREPHELSELNTSLRSGQGAQSFEEMTSLSEDTESLGEPVLTHLPKEITVPPALASQEVGVGKELALQISEGEHSENMSDFETSHSESRPSSPSRNVLGQVSLPSRSSSKSKNSRPNTEEYMHDVYRTHIEQSGLFPRFVATSDPPASPLRYSPQVKVSGDHVLSDPDAETAMSGLLKVGALPLRAGECLSWKPQLSDKKLGRSASHGSTTLDTTSSTSSRRRLHRPITITDNFKRELLKSGTHENVMLKRNP